MPEGNLKIGATVDKDAVTQGMAAAGGEVDKATLGMATSFEQLQGRAKAAWKRISDDTKEAAKSVTADSLRVAEASQAVAQAQSEVRAALRLTTNAQFDQSESSRMLAAAQDALRLKTHELKEAQEEVAIATHESVSGVQATSAAIRGLDGNGGIRAIENFISKTLNLGPAMQMIFPIVGGLMFLGMIGHVVEKLDEMVSGALNAGNAISQAFADMHTKAQLTNIDLQIQLDKLEQERGKLTGHPGNGLQLALDEVIKRTLTLQSNLREDAKAAQELFKQNNVGVLAGMLSGVEGTGTQQKQLTDDMKTLQAAVRTANGAYIKELRNAKTDDERKAAGERHAAAIRAAFQTQINAYRTEAARLKSEQQKSWSQAMATNQATGGAGFAAGIDNSAKIANVEGLADQLTDRLQNFDMSEAIAGADSDVGKLKQGGGGESKAAEQKMRGIETQFAEMGKTAPEVALAFWSKFLAAFQQGSGQYLHVVEQVNHYTEEFEKSLKPNAHLAEQVKKMQALQAETAPEAVTRGIEAMNRAVVEQAEDITRTGERWEGYHRALMQGDVIAAQHRAQMEEGRVRILEMQGAITPLAAAERLAAVHTAEHVEQLKALNAELVELQSAGLKPGDKGYAENQTRQVGVWNQIASLQGAGATQAQGDQSAMSAAVSKPYLQAFDAINQNWLRVQDGLVAGNQRISRDFARMGLNLVQSVAGHFEQMLAKQVQMEIRSVAAHALSNTQKVASDAAGAAASNTINKQSAIKEVFMDAKSAAAKAYKAMAGVPIIGPTVLGPAAAAVTFGAVMSLAAFEKGGIVNGGGPGMAVPILAHDGERVLTARQTTNFERLVNNNNSGSPTFVFGGNHSYNGSGANDFRGQLREHRLELAREIRSLHRDGHFNFASA